MFVLFQDLNQSQTSQQDEEGDNITDPDETGIGEKFPAKKNMAHSSSFGSMMPPEPPKKRYRQFVGSQSHKEISSAITKLDDIANKAGIEKPYDLFGRYVASELRQMPNRAAILLQQEIQNCITRSKLNILESEAAEQELNNYAIIQSPHSIGSITGSSNDDDDILQTAMINTFAPIN